MSLPAIPQQSSIDHADSIDVSSKHEKKKSISALALQDLQLDRRANMGNFKRTKDSIVNAPLTPLAMMTQIGSVAYTQSMTSPPLLNGGTMTRKSNEDIHTTHITPAAVDSDDYYRLFDNARQSVTDINYENNHALPSGINRADSDYRPLVQRDMFWTCLSATDKTVNSDICPSAKL